MSIPNWQRLKGDEALRERLACRGWIKERVRGFFLEQGFTEAETPCLVAHPGMEPNLALFETELRDPARAAASGYLITSPEYALKKLLAAGYSKLFELSRCFRNEEPLGGSHNPEFTMLEWYRTEADYTQLMADTEQLVSGLAQGLFGRTVIDWHNGQLDLATPWPRVSVAEAFQRYVQFDLVRALDDREYFESMAAVKGVAAAPDDTFSDLFFRLFIRYIEPRLGEPGSTGAPWRPVILYDYPAEMAALARLKPSDQRWAERFEVYTGGLELANAFSELTDAAEQRRRLEAEQAERRAAGKPTPPIDEDFLEAVAAMPDSAGIALGFDRLVMLLTNTRDIREVLFFPAGDLFRLPDSASDEAPNR
jgi:lysyl-tRNA synthetase class 2